jgi:hypothetical protein
VRGRTRGEFERVGRPVVVEEAGIEWTRDTTNNKKPENERE